VSTQHPFFILWSGHFLGISIIQSPFQRSKWQLKRIIVTKNEIAVGRASDESETLLDTIPFVDIESIRDMLGDDNANLEKKNGTFQNSLIITTVPGGHNSGRTYYLQASSPELHAKVAQHLISNRKEARKRAEFNTRFAKSQYWLRKIFNSRVFQNLSALLIILVSR
jgi:translation elongation factor EF-1alpha